MPEPSPRPLPGLTEAEHDLVTSYRRVLELLGRIDPARPGLALHGADRAAADLEREARALRAALQAMRERGEDELFPATLATVLRAMDTDRLVRRLLLPPEPPPAAG